MLVRVEDPLDSEGGLRMVAVLRVGLWNLSLVFNLQLDFRSRHCVHENLCTYMSDFSIWSCATTLETSSQISAAMPFRLLDVPSSVGRHVYRGVFLTR